MASSKEFVEYVVESLDKAGITAVYKKMFGEYGLYIDGKYIVAICDNMCYLKPTEAGKTILGEVILQPPYEGAKPYFLIESFDDSKLIRQAIIATWNELPAPKPKKPKFKT